MTNKQMDKPVYIQSLEASDIYEHMKRNRELTKKYHGMIPFSLELIKLRKLEGEKEFNETEIRHSKKHITNDIINVKFKMKVRSGEEIIKGSKKKLKELDGNASDNYKAKLNSYIKLIENEIKDDKWREVKNADLRRYLYQNGFTIKEVDKETGEILETKYVVYKRSSSKSRTGQCLFIKESLHEEMINWSRMYLPFEPNKKIDYAGLLAYESLVGSSLETTIKINPKNMLIIEDIESKFKQTCNVVRTGKNGFLDSFKEETDVVNSLFDGESLLDKKYFPEEQSMLLLRNHMFKSAAFNTNIQEFLKAKCPTEVEYGQWEIPNMFGEVIKAKDIEFIFTPTSLKALKFSDVIGGKKKMWNYWKSLVGEEESIFGICKHEKESKRGKDAEGNVLQQTSYQMLNCLPMSPEDMEKLTVFEKSYINELKNNDEMFIKHIYDEKNDMNSNEMFFNLYHRNNDIVHTKLFRDFRKSTINKYVNHVKKGKVRLNGDYCVLLGNPLEYLYHAIGKKPEEQVLTGSEIHTTLFEPGKELIAFRNPNTSPSNVLIAKNKHVYEITQWFNLTDNIVCVNAIDFAIQDILSGCDYDSDTMVIFENEKLLELGKKCEGKYLVCINGIRPEEEAPYVLNNNDMCTIDNILAESQRNIGEVVNLGQFCLSVYWDMISKGTKEQHLKELLKKIDVMTILSGICIDLAKKIYEIDISNEIKNVQKIAELKRNKPLFWKCLGDPKMKKKNKKKKEYDMYSCPMDFLFNTMDNLKNAKHRENIPLESLLEKRNISNGNRKQEQKLISYVEEKCNEINALYCASMDEEERNKAIDNIIKYYNFKVQKFKVKPDTMVAILVHMVKNKSKNATKLMDILHETQNDVFLQAFKLKNSHFDITNSPKTA
ncbi:hypothetical protein [Bacillus atrophaeus]|uniref:hypothetical protein n=1 Tax=Bacillus atrophaeus TaxID=1452 RepID=UPI00255BCAB9|nr:hypothetical protein [Bacillus atrophaeus]MDL5141106.1 hypothetical protein [Bacillus atrophaeus]